MISLSAQAEFDNWTTNRSKTFCNIDAGMIAISNEHQTRIIANLIIPLKEHDDFTRLGLSIGKTQLLIQSVDENIATGFEFIVTAGEDEYRLFPLKNTEKHYLLGAEKTSSLLSSISKNEFISIAMKLKNGVICVIKVPTKFLMQHYREIEECVT